MNDELYYCDQWLCRIWDVDKEIEQLEFRREKIVCSLSGIGKYDSKTILGGSDSNPTESKNIEFSMISEKIDKLQNQLSSENSRTIDAISKVEDSKLRGMLYGHYINRQPWKKVGEQYFYGKSRTFDYRSMCLKAVCEFIPKEFLYAED